MMLRVAEYTKQTDTGMQRKANEDAYFARSPLFAVADGMGGAQAGEVASGLAVRVLEGGLPAGAGSVAERLATAVQEANAEIFRRQNEDSGLKGMGTTFTLAYLGEEDLTIAHVGDSRAYRWRGGALELLTDDHSLVGELVRQGKLTQEEADEHPQRSIITRALGPEADVDVDTHAWKAEDGDVYLLCSDGLTSMIHEQEIAQVLASATSVPAAGRALVAAANAAGGRDNITVVLFRVEEVGGVDPGRSGAAADAAAPPTAPLEPAAVGSAGAAGLEFDDVRRAVDEAEQRAAEAEARRRQPRAPVPAPAPPKRRRLGKRTRTALKVLAVVLVILVPVAIGGYFASQTVYFVGSDENGFVTLYRGLPYSLPGGIDLYTENFVTGVNVDQLPPARRAALLDQRLRSRDDAVDLVRQIDQDKITPQ